MLSKDVPLNTKGAISLYKVYGDSALLDLNGTLLKNINALLALTRRYTKLSRECRKALRSKFMSSGKKIIKVRFTVTYTK